MGKPKPRARLVVLLAAVIGLGWFMFLNGAAMSVAAVRLLGDEGLHILVPLSGCAMLAFLGHLMRAQRTRCLLRQVRCGSLAPQFLSLSAGYYFDIVFPFRLGEVVRAILLGRQLRAPLLFTLTAVVLERLLDVIAVAGLFLFGVAIVGGPVRSGVIAAVGGVIAAGLLFALMQLFSRNRVAAGVVWRVSRLFSEQLQRQLRMAVWSTSRAMQQFFSSRRSVVSYASWALGSWICYLGAAAGWLFAIAGSARPVGLADIVVPFVSPDVLLNLQLFAAYVDSLASFYVSSGFAAGASGLDVASGMWFILNLPIMVLGFAACVLPRISGRFRVQPSAKRPQASDISSRELADFLDSYFQRHDMAQALHNLDVRGELELIQFFRGGSDAVTALVQDSSGLKVLKLVPPRYQANLRRQYQWLRRFRNVASIVDVTGERTEDESYRIELAYRPECVPLFDYIHTRPVESSAKVLDRVWQAMREEVYDSQPVSSHDRELRDYLDDRLYRRLDLAVGAHPALRRAAGCRTVIVNGVSLQGIRVVLDQIETNERAMADLARYRASTAIHGDLTIDNILVDLATGVPTIIDPSDDNQVRGPVIDVARQLQSLRGGYEFVEAAAPFMRVAFDSRADEMAVTLPLRRSVEYATLERWLADTSQDWLESSEIRSLPFHIGLFFGRMLTHRIVIDPDTVLAYFAQAVVFLNEFNEQYRP